MFNSLFKKHPDECEEQTSPKAENTGNDTNEEVPSQQTNQNSEIEILKATCQELKNQYEILLEQVKKAGLKLEPATAAPEATTIEEPPKEQTEAPVAPTTTAEEPMAITPVTIEVVEEIIVVEAAATVGIEAPATGGIPAPTDKPQTPVTAQPCQVDIQPIINDLKLIKEAMSDMERKETIIKELHEELQKYKAGMKKDITAPLLKTIIKIYDNFSSLNAFYIAEMEKEENQSPMISKILKEYQNATHSIIDIIYDYDIEPIIVEVGDTYNPKKHRATETIEVDDTAKDKTIASIRKIGFEDVVLDRIMRHAEVLVCKLKENK